MSLTTAVHERTLSLAQNPALELGDAGGRRRARRWSRDVVGGPSTEESQRSGPPQPVTGRFLGRPGFNPTPTIPPANGTGSGPRSAHQTSLPTSLPCD